MKQGASVLSKRCVKVRNTPAKFWADIEDAYYEIDLKGYSVYYNPAFFRMLGYTPEEIKGKNHSQRQNTEMAAWTYKIFNEVFRTGIAKQNEEWECLHKNGNVVRVEGSINPVRDVTGKMIGFHGFLRDVTERRKIEQALRESEERLLRMRENEERLLKLEHRITLDLAEVPSIHRVAELLIHHVCQSEGWEAGAYWVPGNEADTLQLSACWPHRKPAATCPNPDKPDHHGCAVKPDHCLQDV